MIRKFRAYNENIDRWCYFKIVVDENGWELCYFHYQMGDKCNATIEQNFETAYFNLQRIIEQNGLTKLTEITGDHA